MCVLYRMPHKEDMEFLLESFKISCPAVPENAGEHLCGVERRPVLAQFPLLFGSVLVRQWNAAGKLQPPNQSCGK